MKRTYFNIFVLAAVCAVTQMQAMDMNKETGTQVKKADKQEKSSSQTCSCMAKTLCGLAAAYCVMTSGQSVNESRPCQPCIVATGPAAVGLEDCKSTLSPEPGYAASSWSDLIKARNRYKQAACQEDEPRKVGQLKHDYDDYI